MRLLKKLVFAVVTMLPVSASAEEFWLQVQTFDDGSTIFWSPHSRRGNTDLWFSKWKVESSPTDVSVIRLFTAVCKRSGIPGTVHMRNIRQTLCEREVCRKVKDEKVWTLYKNDQLGGQICTISEPPLRIRVRED